MIRFHYCELFEKKIRNQVFEKAVKSKIAEKTIFDDLKGLGSLNSFTGGVYILKTSNPLNRIIIQKETIDIDGEKICVYFVRDIISNNKFEYNYSKVVLPAIIKGSWLATNPLSVIDKNNFIESFKAQKIINKEDRLYIPESMTGWLKNFELKLNYEIFETEDWVKYALNDSESDGLLDKYVNTFRLLFDDIITHKNESKILFTKNSIEICSYTKYNLGILFSKIIDKENEIFVFYNGAHTINQKEYWEKAIRKIDEQGVPFDSNVESISRSAFRAYPKWTIQNENLWFFIQKSSEMSNLSLTREQIDFLKHFKFPYYINGQAGSGKSTMLYYLFTNIYIYKCLDELKGKIIFLTENEILLEQTKKSVFDLLNNNAEFNGLSIEQKENSKNCFSSFKKFLRDLLSDDDKSKFNEDKYLNFSTFKFLYENSHIHKHIINKYTAEESWFTIITYIYGYNIDNKILSRNYSDSVKEKSQIIPKEKFEGIERYVLPFYEKLINEEGYWDKLKIIRFIEEHKIPKPEYSVVICDEAQDFCRVELRFILRLSEYLKYDLSQIEQVPIIFAGDPNQTVNPTGFRQGEITSMLFEELKEIATFDYNTKENVYNPVFNYRSSQSVVSLANFVQYYRKKNLGIQLVEPQEAKRPDIYTGQNFNTFISYHKIETDENLMRDLIHKLKYKIFIVPVDTQDKEEYKTKNKLLSLIDNAEIKTSVEAKGAEYEQVVLFGFGDYFETHFDSLYNEKIDQNELFKKSFFFNKLYVGLTRARTELLIIDSNESKLNFWQELVNKIDTFDDNWKILNDFKETTIQYDTDSINHIITSTAEDALKNAEKDKEQGTYDSNSARLKVAANQFFKLGKKGDGYECTAIAEQITGNLRKAAELFLNSELKNTKLEEAAFCLFKGRYFKELIEEIGYKLRNIKQDIRIIIARLISGNKLMNLDIDVLYKNRHTLCDLINDLEWRNELIALLIDNSKAIIEKEFRKHLADVFESIAKNEDIDLWKIIGDIYFELSDYEKAINAWNTIDLFDSENYIQAQIELAKSKNEYEKIVLWLGELHKIKTSKHEENQIFTETIDNYRKNPEISISNSNYYLFVYKAIALQMPQFNIELIGKKTEIEFKNNLSEVKNFYYEILTLTTLNTKVVVYLLERWAKITWKINHLNINSLWLNELNTEYFNVTKIHHIPFIEFNFTELSEIAEYPLPILWNPPNHFSNIVIRNFRQFNRLELKKVGQFNLIVGDNNVGKTSLLEALLISANKDEYFTNLAFAFAERKNIARCNDEFNQEHFHLPNNFIYDFIKKNISKKEIEYIISEKRNTWTYTVKEATLEDIQHINQFAVNVDTDDFFSLRTENTIELIEFPLLLKKMNPMDIIKSPFIPYGKGFGKDLAQVYLDKIDRKKTERERFLKYMEIFIPNIDRISPDTVTGEIVIEEKGTEESASLHQYGEGANKLFRIIIQIMLQKDKRILIDEIDSGIHYSRFAEFWKIILKVAKENNVQIFATTHNFECIKHFKEIVTEKDFVSFQSDSRIITLLQLPNKNIKTYTRVFNEFQYEIDNNFELRGGDL